MTWPVYCTLVLPLLLALPAGRMARAGAPQAAARVLAGCLAVAAASSAAGLVLIVLTLADDIPALERRQRAARRVGEMLPEPVPDLVAVCALLPLAWIGWRVGAEVWRRRRVLRELHGAGEPHDGLLVADWDRPHAVAMPRSGTGRPEYVLVTSGLLRMLDARERAAVLAHERAHLRYSHHRLTTTAAVAAALNPLLRPAAAAVALLAERAADEAAAQSVGDRRLVARALAKVALAARPGEALPRPAIGGSSVVQRVGALLAAPARPGPGWGWAAGGVAVAVLAAAGLAFHDFVQVVIAWWPAP